jgi:lipoprotein-releasing system permease protein
MNIEPYIALRYLKPRRGNFFITLIGLISVAGVTVGVTSIILVLSILNGFEREVKSRFIGFDAHLKVKRPHDEAISNWQKVAESLAQHKSVAAVSPYILEKAMITSSYGNHVSYIKGTKENTIVKVTALQKDMVSGTIDFSKQKESFDGIVVGYNLAVQLNVNTEDTLTVISPAGVTSPFSSPIAKRFITTGVFKTDMFEYDNAYVFLSLEDAQNLFEMEDQISGLDIKCDDIDNSFQVQKEIGDDLGDDFVVETWYDQHSDLYGAMKIEKWGSLVLLSLIIVVAGFNIVSTLIMLVMQKTPEIGILKSLGASSRMISRIFIRQGLIIGGIGIILGCIIGYSICFLQIHYRIVKLPGDIFFLDAIPVELKGIDFFAIVLVAFFLCLFSTFYPARKASGLLPVEALRS